MKVFYLLVFCMLSGLFACNNSNQTPEQEQEEDIQFIRPQPKSDTVNAFQSKTLQIKKASL